MGTTVEEVLDKEVIEQLEIEGNLVSVKKVTKPLTNEDINLLMTWAILEEARLINAVKSNFKRMERYPKLFDMMYKYSGKQTELKLIANRLKVLEKQYEDLKGGGSSGRVLPRDSRTDQGSGPEAPKGDWQKYKEPESA